MSGIKLNGYGLSEAQVAAIQDVVNAVAPGAAGVQSVGGQGGIVSLRTVGGVSLTDGGGDIPVGTGGGTAGAISIPFSTTLPLDTVGDGKIMPAHILNAAAVFSVSGAIQDGNLSFSLIGDGDPSHVPDFTAFNNVFAYVFDHSIDANNVYNVVRSFGTNFIFGALGDAVDVTGPTLVSATVSDSNPLRIDLVWSEAINSTVSAAAAFAISAGHTITAHTYDSATTSHLTVTTPFVTGETARQLNYTQPVSNKMQDLVGNLVLNFINAPVTNNVGTPTLLSAVVANSTPTRIDLTWSESMNSTVPSQAAFAVSSGHVLSSHTYDDATHSHLITATAFVNGETKTLAYTPPGTNDMKDSAGGNLVAAFSGVSITDNVGGGRITFDDPFTGADGDAPNVRWTPTHAGWTIQGNALSYGGSAFGELNTPCTPGNNTWTLYGVNHVGAGFGFGELINSYVDANNGWTVQADASNQLRIIQTVAGVSTTLVTDTGHTTRLNGTGDPVVTVVGTLVTVTFNGDDPGSISATVNAACINGAVCGVGMNGPGKDANVWPRIVLS